MEKIHNSSGSFSRILRVRAFLATVLTIGATVGFFQKIIPYDAYMPLVTMALGFLFGQASPMEVPKSLETPKPTTTTQPTV